MDSREKDGINLAQNRKSETQNNLGLPFLEGTLFGDFSHVMSGAKWAFFEGFFLFAVKGQLNRPPPVWRVALF